MKSNNKEFSRHERVAAEIKRTLATPLSEIARHAGFGLVTISEVRVSMDYKSAIVFLSIYSGNTVGKDFFSLVVNHQKGLQQLLNSRLRLKRVPKIILEPDKTESINEKITELLNECSKPSCF